MTAVPRDRENHTSLRLYSLAAQEAAAVILRRYSSSFSTGARMLAPVQRGMIADVYSLVRLADEIVDTYRGDDADVLLNDLERETFAAIERGYSTNIVVHAFVATANASGIGADQITPFFASMRTDLETTTHDEESFARYVFGSAEVVGEMCLLVFLYGTGRSPTSRAVEGARKLGSAYQKINFLRDLGTDVDELGREYFPGVKARNLDQTTLNRLVADCWSDIKVARACLDELPFRPRAGVRASIALYVNLLRRIARTPATRLVERRVRVPGPRKALLAAGAIMATAVGR